MSIREIYRQRVKPIKDWHDGLARLEAKADPEANQRVRTESRIRVEKLVREWGIPKSMEELAAELNGSVTSNWRENKLTDEYGDEVFRASIVFHDHSYPGNFSYGWNPEDNAWIDVRVCSPEKDVDVRIQGHEIHTSEEFDTQLVESVLDPRHPPHYEQDAPA